MFVVYSNRSGNVMYQTKNEAEAMCAFYKCTQIAILDSIEVCRVPDGIDPAPRPRVADGIFNNSIMFFAIVGAHTLESYNG